MDQRIRKLNLNDKQEMEDVQLYLEMIIEEMNKKYGLSREESLNQMESSGFNDLFTSDPYYFFHYNIEYAADFIYGSKGKNRKT